MTTIIEFLGFMRDNGVPWWSCETQLAGQVWARGKKRGPRAEFSLPDVIKGSPCHPEKAELSISEVMNTRFFLVGYKPADLRAKFATESEFMAALEKWKTENNGKEVEQHGEAKDTD